MLNRKTRIGLKITGWVIIIVLGIIHFINRNDLSMLYNGFKGFVYVVMFFVAITLIFFMNPNREK